MARSKDLQLDVIYLSDGTYNASVGVRGGLPGGRASQRRRSADGSCSDELGAYARLRLQPGETLVAETCGGGGYGAPTDRDPLRVAQDVREGWISRARAYTVYGVAISDDGRIDEAATREQRRQLSGADSAH